MPSHSDGTSRKDSDMESVARQAWDDFFKEIETENQHDPGSSLIKISSNNPPSLSNSASSSSESHVAQSKGKRKLSAPKESVSEECAPSRPVSENSDDPTKFCPERCLFCLQTSEHFDQNLAHMENWHRFIIPLEGGLSPHAMPPMALIHYLHLKKNNDPPALLEELCELKSKPTSERFSHALNRAIARRKQGDFIEEYRHMFRNGSKISHHREAIVNDPVLGNLYFREIDYRAIEEETERSRKWLKKNADGLLKYNL
ncbi:hypothetical protein NW768_010099 [Fusarium equiseti]|uniref:Uncharacterized protein n=1 Tax=Fusarium equiseti TaxID=61235 RepID=A0ABQ8R1U0_FUSEQ|nr:hypothetical protein NW768_010099 [Fusarium equiseti]